MTDHLDLDEIAGRAAGLYEYATGLDDAWQDEADQLAGTDVPALIDEIRRLRTEVAGPNAETLRAAGWVECSPEWLAANPGQCATAPRVPGGTAVSHWHPVKQPDPGNAPCGHDDYHDPHEWADRPGVWCPGISFADDEPASRVS